MTESDNFIVYDLPMILSRKVMKLDPDNDGKWIEDRDWHEFMKKIYAALFSFFCRNNLVLDGRIDLEEIDKIVLRFNDF